MKSAHKAGAELATFIFIAIPDSQIQFEFGRKIQIQIQLSGFSQTAYNKKLIKSNEKYNEMVLHFNLKEIFRNFDFFHFFPK